jgi:hypothetical protein
MATEVQPPRSFRATDERSLGELFKQLRNETTTLFRQEVRLAKAETAEKARSYGRHSTVLGVGGALAFAALLLLLTGLSYLVSAGLVAAGVSAVHAAWLGLLIVGVVVGIIGYIMVRKGINAMKRESPIPERTLQTLQENQEWVKHKLR